MFNFLPEAFYLPHVTACQSASQPLQPSSQESLFSPPYRDEVYKKAGGVYRREGQKAQRITAGMFRTYTGIGGKKFKDCIHKFELEPKQYAGLALKMTAQLVGGKCKNCS